MRQIHFFVQKKFDKALFLYSHIIKFSRTKSIKFMHYFMILQRKMFKKAMSLYDYFTVVKDEN